MDIVNINDDLSCYTIQYNKIIYSIDFFVVRYVTMVSSQPHLMLSKTEFSRSSHKLRS